MSLSPNDDVPDEVPDEVLALRLCLHANGWEPVPVQGKRPLVAGWQAGEITPARIRAERNDHPDLASTGLRTGHLVGSDIDVKDAGEAGRIQKVVEQHLGASPFVRVGQKGMMLCYRTDEPIRKITISSSDGTKVEILGSGQQFVAYGIHPDTGKPYTWINEGREPARAETWELPLVTADQLRSLAPELAKALARHHPDVRITGDIEVRPANDHAAPSGTPLPPDELRARLFCCDPDMERGKWRDLAAGFHATPCTDPEFDKRAQFVEWSQRGLKYQSVEDCELIYDTMPPKEGGIRAGTFIKLTNEAGYAGSSAGRSSAEVFKQFAREHGSNAANDDAEFPQPKTAAELVAGDFPRAEHLWEKFILWRKVNLLYGDGGTGKTLLAEHVAVAVAAGVELFGLGVKQSPVLLILAEDDDGETKARLEAICALLGVNLADLPIKTWCLPGWDAVLAHITDDGSWEPGEFMEPLRTELAKIGPCFLVLDTVSDIATLDETKRMPVNKLCKVVLTGLCREFGATILVNAHPSKAAMADGSDYAGSTAWNNAVRNRLTLKRPNPASSQRVLKVAKANYSETPELELYQVGLTLVTAPEAGHSEAEERAAVLATVLELLDQGVLFVRSNGAGQKPKDLAKAISERHGLHLEPSRVLDHLNTLERHGRLQYEKGGNAKRGQKAGFRRPVASSVASPS